MRHHVVVSSSWSTVESVIHTYYLLVAPTIRVYKGCFIFLAFAFQSPDWVSYGYDGHSTKNERCILMVIGFDDGDDIIRRIWRELTRKTSHFQNRNITALIFPSRSVHDFHRLVTITLSRPRHMVAAKVG